MRHIPTATFAILTATLLLGACSKSAAPSSDSPSQSSLSNALSPAAVQQAAQAAKTASLPEANLTTPDKDYVNIDKGNEVMFLYAAFSGLPVDYDKMAQAFSSEYRSTSDAFKKHDLLAALQPKLDAGIADAKAHPYISWDDDSPQLAHYDFAQKSFQVGSAIFQKGGYLTFNDNSGYVLAVNNGQAFQQLHEADDDKARAIEALVGKYPSMHLKIFAFVQATDDSGTPTVQAAVTKVQLLDSHGQVLLEVAAK
jgi:hypothetical protein